MKRTERTSPSDGIELDDEHRPLTCPNCGTERHGEYCHGCGQRFLKDRLTVWELWWLFAERFLDWEEGVWRTFLKMAKSPGVVIRDFLGGKRKTYLNPFSYLLFCVGLYGLGQFVMRRIAGLKGVPSVADLQEMGVALNNTEDQFTLIAYTTVLVVAVLAITMRIMFDGRLLNAMEAIVTSIYTSGNVIALALGVSIVEFIFTGDPLTIEGLIPTFILLFPVCMFHTGYGLFESWGMAGYSGIVPVIAGFIGIVTSFLGMGVVIFAADSISSDGGMVVSMFGGLTILCGPALILVLYLLDITG